MVGPLITCKRGSLKADGIPHGYDAEKYLFTAVMDENESWLLEKNMDTYCTSPKCGGISKGVFTLNSGTQILIYFWE